MRRLLLATLALAGCATTANYEKMLNSWVGAPEADLIRRWGPPMSAYQTGSSKFLQYSNSRNVFLPGVAPTYQTTVYGNTAYTNTVGGSPAMNIGLVCRTTFEVRDDRVVNWSWEGNDCKARE